MFTENVDIVYAIFLTMIIGSVAMLLIEFYGLRWFAALLNILNIISYLVYFYFVSLSIRNRKPHIRRMDSTAFWCFRICFS